MTLSDERLILASILVLMDFPLKPTARKHRLGGVAHASILVLMDFPLKPKDGTGKVALIKGLQSLF